MPRPLYRWVCRHFTEVLPLLELYMMPSTSRAFTKVILRIFLRVTLSNGLHVYDAPLVPLREDLAIVQVCLGGEGPAGAGQNELAEALQIA